LNATKNVRWKVSYLNDSQLNVPYTSNNTILTIKGRIPGVYKVSATCWDTLKDYSEITLKFQCKLRYLAGYVASYIAS